MPILQLTILECSPKQSGGLAILLCSSIKENLRQGVGIPEVYDTTMLLKLNKSGSGQETEIVGIVMIPAEGSMNSDSKFSEEEPEKPGVPPEEEQDSQGDPCTIVDPSDSDSSAPEAYLEEPGVVDPPPECPEPLP
ncbi:UNVERIFIED_CONTAM: hypothetical protein K2H54_072265 [Gekko kuhli]